MDNAVYIVDDLNEIRQWLSRLLQSETHAAREFASAESSLREPISSARACLVLDVRLPNLSEFDVLDTQADKQSALPVLIITSHGTIPTTLRALKAGAREYPAMPIHSGEIIRAVDEALAWNDEACATDDLLLESRQKYETLTLRQREVLSLVTDGLQNKQIAVALGIQEVTVKFHRKKAMEKMGAKTIVDLVRVSDRLNLTSTKVWSRKN